MRHPDLDYKHTDLPLGQLQPILELRIKSAEPVRRPTPLAECRRHVQQELMFLPSEHQRLSNPHPYRVGLSDALWRLRRDLIEKLA
jgi:nicotinate phosphoribosyltransferase